MRVSRTHTGDLEIECDCGLMFIVQWSALVQSTRLGYQCPCGEQFEISAKGVVQSGSGKAVAGGATARARSGGHSQHGAGVALESRTHRTRAGRAARAGEGPELATFDALGPLEAHRVWRVHNGWLVSTSVDERWHPGLIHASCLQQGPEAVAPDPYCQCGVWALKQASAEGLTSIYRVVSEMFLQLHAGELAFGAVRLWGDVAEFERGYRAEWAAPTALYTCWDPGHEYEMVELANAYGIPIVDVPDTLREQLARWQMERQHFSGNEVAMNYAAGNHMHVQARSLAMSIQATAEQEWAAKRRRRSRNWFFFGLPFVAANLWLFSGAIANGRPWWQLAGHAFATFIAGAAVSGAYTAWRK